MRRVSEQQRLRLRTSQSSRLRIWGSGVRISPGAPLLRWNLERQKVALGNVWGNGKQKEFLVRAPVPENAALTAPDCMLNAPDDDSVPFWIVPPASVTPPFCVCVVPPRSSVA